MLMKTPTVMDLASLARFIMSPDCQSIGILTGAGVSVASGIPDFRSPGGMYDTLRPELITATPAQQAAMNQDPTNVVSWEMFSQNAFPYLEVRRPFILGTQQKKWKATIAHRFFELLHTQTNKLTRLYTQNIDGLDYQCNIPLDKIVAVHGTIGQAGCESCGFSVDMRTFCNQVETRIKDIYKVDPTAPKESSPINCENCGKATVKPRTVLFGRNLPKQFFECAVQDLPNLDLLIVAGTSLVVSPANSLVYNVPESTVRVVVNMEQVGTELGMDFQGKDFFARGTCDQVFLDLITELNWREELECIADQLPESSQQLLR